MSSSTQKALAWGVMSVLLGEGLPILLLYFLALEKKVPFISYLRVYIGYAGPITMAYGILAAALIDILLDEKTIANCTRHCADVVLSIPVLWWAFEAQLGRVAPVTNFTMAVSALAAIMAFIGAGHAKRDSWRRLTPPC